MGHFLFDVNSNKLAVAEKPQVMTILQEDQGVVSPRRLGKPPRGL